MGDYEMRTGFDERTEQEVLILEQIVDDYYIAEGYKGYLIVNVNEIELYSGE